MEELKTIFLEAGVPKEDIENVITKLGLTCADDLAYFTDADAFANAGVVGMLAQRKLAEVGAKLKADKAAAAAESQTANHEKTELDFSLLADDINEEQWLNNLRMSGILKFDEATYVAGIKAVLAANLGVFASIEKLIMMIDDYAVKNAIPAPLSFYNLQNIMTRRQYGLVFAASEDNCMNGVPIYATTHDMNALVEKMKSDFVPTILSAAEKVSIWYNDLSMQKTTDFFMEKTLQSQTATQNLSYPNPAALYDAGAELRQSINRTFAGNGIQKALAIYNEYHTFVDVLNDPELPRSIGVLDKDSVLNLLGFDANAAAVRSEGFIVKFVISIMNADKLARTNEVLFFRELYDLVRQIDWSALTGDPQDVDMFKARPGGVPFLNVGVTAQPRFSGARLETHPSPGIQQMDGKLLPEQG